MPGPQLLHVEDDAPLRRSVLLTLADEGFEVLGAADGAEALRQLDRGPDAVLLDLGLPDVDGFELCRRVRARTGMPVLVLSVQRAPDDVARALASGADDYLAKPFPTGDLARRLWALLAPDPLLGPAGAAVGAAGPASPGGAALTVTEARLLAALEAARDAGVDGVTLLRQVWGVPPVAGQAALVARARSLGVKLGATGGPSVVTTASGYRLGP